MNDIQELCVISYPEIDDLEQDGFNLIGSKDGVKFDIYNTLEDAIVYSYFNPEAIKYILDPEDVAKIPAIIEKYNLMQEFKNKE